MFFGFATGCEDEVVCSSYDCIELSLLSQLVAKEKNKRVVNSKFEAPDDTEVYEARRDGFFLRQSLFRCFHIGFGMMSGLKTGKLVIPQLKPASLSVLVRAKTEARMWIEETYFPRDLSCSLWLNFSRFIDTFSSFFDYTKIIYLCRDATTCSLDKVVSLADGYAVIFVQCGCEILDCQRILLVFDGFSVFVLLYFVRALWCRWSGLAMLECIVGHIRDELLSGNRD